MTNRPNIIPLHTEDNITEKHEHSPSGIRNWGPSVRVVKTTRDHCDRKWCFTVSHIRSRSQATDMVSRCVQLFQAKSAQQWYEVFQVERTLCTHVLELWQLVTEVGLHLATSQPPSPVSFSLRQTVTHPTLSMSLTLWILNKNNTPSAAVLLELCSVTTITY
jgi:hypothetical protein